MRSTFKKPLLIGAAVVLTSATALVVTGGPAMAAPSGCSGRANYVIPGNFVSFCSGGSGYYEAIAYCSANPTQGSAFTYIFGPTVSVGHSSVADCPSNKKYLQGGKTAVL